MRENLDKINFTVLDERVLSIPYSEWDPKAVKGKKLEEYLGTDINCRLDSYDCLLYTLITTIWDSTPISFAADSNYRCFFAVTVLAAYFSRLGNSYISGEYSKEILRIIINREEGVF